MRANSPDTAAVPAHPARWPDLASRALMAAMFGVFALAHLLSFIEERRISLLLFVFAESMVAWFFVTRSQARASTHSPVAWLVACAGTLLPLCLRPAPEALFAGADWFAAAGALLQTAGLLSLNRSFSIVPALREIKTQGAYRWLRHPIYASYLISIGAYVAGNASARNLLLALAFYATLIARIHFEERLLCRDEEYREYVRRVRWRVIPGLY